MTRTTKRNAAKVVAAALQTQTQRLRADKPPPDGAGAFALLTAYLSKRTTP